MELPAVAFPHQMDFTHLKLVHSYGRLRSDLLHRVNISDGMLATAHDVPARAPIEFLRVPEPPLPRGSAAWDHSVRVVMLRRSGEIANENTGALEPWFVAVDVCRALNIQVRKNGAVNAGNATRALNEDEVTLQKMVGFRGPAAQVISESGLYKLVMRAHRSNPEAKAFQDWVTQDVLPAILAAPPLARTAAMSWVRRR